MSKDEETVKLESMFDNLPPHIQLIAEKLAVKQMFAALHAEKLEDVRVKETALRNEFAVMAEEIETLKAELREECHRFAKQKENR